MIEALLAGSAAGVVADRILAWIVPEEQTPTVRLLAMAVARLEILAQNTDIQTPPRDEIVSLQAYPWEYVVAEDHHPHLSILVPSYNQAGSAITSAQLKFVIPGMATLIENVFIGWTQLDLPAGT